MVTEIKSVPEFEDAVWQTCLDEPAVPGDGASLKDWGDYIANLLAFGRDCKAKVVGGKEQQDKRRAELTPKK